ncbi:unnamed protein product [Lathyrus oleraceus]
MSENCKSKNNKDCFGQKWISALKIQFHAQYPFEDGQHMILIRVSLAWIQYVRQFIEESMCLQVSSCQYTDS